MKAREVEIVEIRCQEMLNRIEELRNSSQGQNFDKPRIDCSFFASKESAAVKRVSMDLTRALTRMRKS